MIKYNNEQNLKNNRFKREIVTGRYNEQLYSINIAVRTNVKNVHYLSNFCLEKKVLNRAKLHEVYRDQKISNYI